MKGMTTALLVVTILASIVRGAVAESSSIGVVVTSDRDPDNFADPKTIQHGTQYFEMMGNRAIYKDGWMASTTPLRLPWVTIGSEPNPDDFKWELYNINEDFSQANNLAEKYPDKLKELQEVFDVEARRYNVYPLD